MMDTSEKRTPSTGPYLVRFRVKLTDKECCDNSGLKRLRCIVFAVREQCNKDYNKITRFYVVSFVTIKDVFFEVLYQAMYVRCLTLSGSNTTVSHLNRHSLLYVE